MKYRIWKLKDTKLYGIVSSPVIDSIFHDFASADKKVKEFAAKNIPNISYMIESYELGTPRFNNRRIMTGQTDYLVVHEGLQNVQSVKERLNTAIQRLMDMRDSNGHLSDCAFCLTTFGKEIIALGEECFEAHRIEKNGMDDYSLTEAHAIIADYNTKFPAIDTPTYPVGDKLNKFVRSLLITMEIDKSLTK